MLDASQHYNSAQDKWFGLRQFYVRRFLRIFPLYYLVLLLVLLLKVQPIQQSWPWHAAYLSNFYLWRFGSAQAYGAHFWSLSVEEQFYLCWPMLMFFVPGKWRLVCILTMVSFAPGFRWVMSHWGANPNRAVWLTPACLDSLGLGALLAYLDRKSVIPRTRLGLILLIIGVAGCTFVYLTGWMSMFRRTFLACCLAWLVWRASEGVLGGFGRFLTWKPVAYLGKINYGVYVLHPFAVALWVWALDSAPVPGYRVFARLHIPPAFYHHEAITMLMMVAITIPAAVLSFRFYETPLNNLKRFFPSLKSEPSPRPELPVAPGVSEDERAKPICPPSHPAG